MRKYTQASKPETVDTPEQESPQQPELPLDEPDQPTLPPEKRPY